MHIRTQIANEEPLFGLEENPVEIDALEMSEQRRVIVEHARTDG
jgi:hypothetical protein